MKSYAMQKVMDRRVFIGTAFLCLALQTLYGQQVVSNYTHTHLVAENTVRRLMSESMQQYGSKRIVSNLEDINKNFAKLIVARNQIYQSLVNVNEALKDGKTVIQMEQVLSDIVKERSELLRLVGQHPQFAPLAERQSREIVGQAIGILNDVNTYIIGSGGELLMDYNARDEMLMAFSHRLRLLRGAIYGTRISIMWAVRHGLWKSLNPFQNWINQDRAIMEDIMRKHKSFKK